MPFPFLPTGALVALAVLVSALTVFGLALRAMDRAATRVAGELRLSIVPAIVSGMRRWTPSAGPARSTDAGVESTASQSGIEIIDLDDGGRPAD
jgi:hypothetical protein